MEERLRGWRCLGWDNGKEDVMQLKKIVALVTAFAMLIPAAGCSEKEKSSSSVAERSCPASDQRGSLPIRAGSRRVISKIRKTMTMSIMTTSTTMMRTTTITPMTTATHRRQRTAGSSPWMPSPTSAVLVGNCWSTAFPSLRRQSAL